MKRTQPAENKQSKNFLCDPASFIITEEDEAAIEKLLASDESTDGFEQTPRARKSLPA